MLWMSPKMAVCRCKPISCHPCCNPMKNGKGGKDKGKECMGPTLSDMNRVLIERDGMHDGCFKKETQVHTTACRYWSWLFELPVPPLQAAVRTCHCKQASKQITKPPIASEDVWSRWCWTSSTSFEAKNHTSSCSTSI